MFETPAKEHHLLDKMVGEWTYEGECSMGPGQPPMKSEGTEVVRSLGALWILAEGEGSMPDSGVSKSVMTIGFDPKSGRYVGTFIVSVMTHLWVYNGVMDSSGRAITLDTQGPSFSGEGMANYQDIIEFLDD